MALLGHKNQAANNSAATTPATHHGTVNKSHHAVGNPLKSIGARVITAYLLTVWLVWFAVEIAIHSASTDPSIRGWRTLLASSYINYGIQGLILLGSLTALWYSEAVRTRNTQLMAFTVSTFVVFTWFLNFSFVRNNLNNGDIRGYCDNTIVNGQSLATSGSTLFGTSSQLCRLSRAAAILSVLMEAGQFALHLYCLARLLLPLTDPTVTEEQRLVTEACQLDTSAAKVKSVNSLNKSVIAFTLLSLAGYIVFTLSWIKIQTYQYPTTFVGPVGDPLINQMGWQLSLLWAVTYAASILAAGRHSRGVTALAFGLTTTSALALWSFFIFSARRIQQSDRLTTVVFPDAERAVVAGLGIMLVFETLRAVTLIARYYTYIPVMLAPQSLGVDGRALIHSHWPAAHNNKTVTGPTNGPTSGSAANYPTQANMGGNAIGNSNTTDGLPTATKAIPASFVMPVFANASRLLKAIVLTHVLVTVAWFITQLVLECHPGLFTDIAATFNPSRPFPALYLDPERTFLYHLLIGIAAISVCYFSERIPLHCTAVGAATALTVLVSAWFLLMWPALYDFVYDRSVSQNVMLTSPITQDYSRGAKAIAIFGFLQLLALGVMFGYALTRAAARTTVVTKRGLQLFSTLAAIGTLIWALSAIKRNISSTGYTSPYAPGINNDGYLYMAAFFLMTTVAFSCWTNSLTATSDLPNTSRGWKELCWLSTWITFTFMLPTFILACRWINFDDWNNSTPVTALPFVNNPTNSSASLAICAGLIILGAAVAMETFDVFMLISTPRLGLSKSSGVNAAHHASGDPTTTTGKGLSERDLEAGVAAVPGQSVASGMIKDVNNPGNQNYINTSGMNVVAASTTVSPHHTLNTAPYDEAAESRRGSNDVSVAEPVNFHTSQANNTVVV